MDLNKFLDKTVKNFKTDDFSGFKIYNGKVRDIIDLGDKLIITASDRISAFDKILTTIPCKGEILNRMAMFWFDSTKDIIDNHIIKKISARTVLVKKCEVLPVEVIVRGYLTGSAWRDYKSGKDISGIVLPHGMRADQKFDKPIITPSTKAEMGEHDMPISCAEIVAKGLVKKEVWEQVEKMAVKLFKRGSEIADKNGLILVDTKYEFGILNGKLVLVDEVHTPDSSRYWYKDSYNKLFEAGEDQRKVDKEFLRQWLIEKGWMGTGNPPAIDDKMRVAIAEKYITAFETVTGVKFIPESLSVQDEITLIKKHLN